MLTPRLNDEQLQTALARLRQESPPPVIWLFGKVQSGKTSIIRALTGAERAQIGSGFAPCTRWASRYEFPNSEFPLAVFLDTRGIGEVGYDPQEDFAAFRDQAHMLLVVVRAMDMALEPLVSALEPLVRDKPTWPIVVAQTTLHQGYPPDMPEHLVPYPFGKEPWSSQVPNDLARALRFQRSVFDCIPVKQFVPIDFTLPEDGFSEQFYGRTALLSALAEAHPHAVYQTLQQLPQLTKELKSLHFRQAQPHILAYAVLAGAAGATPLPIADLPLISALQLKMLHTVASVYHQPMKVKTFLELAGTFGAGLLLRQGARSLLKIIPGFGNAISGLYAGATTYALGCALCFYYQEVFDGHLPRAEQIKVFYEDKLAEDDAATQEKWWEKRGREMNLDSTSPRLSSPQPLAPSSQIRGWRLWTLALLLAIPVLAFGVAGALWLYDRGWLGWMGLGFLLVEALVLVLFRRWSRIPGVVLPQPSTELPADLAPRDEGAWKVVQEYIDRVDRGELTLTSTEQLWSLGHEILTRIAIFYHPNDKEPLLAVQVPLLCRAIEETARDLATITSEVPFAHRITIGDAVRGYRLQQKIKPAYDIYKMFYPMLNWKNALFQLFVTDRLFNLTKETLQQWIFKWYIDRVGYHAIELYSGKLLLTRRIEGRLPFSAESQTILETPEATTEPLRILVLGQVKAGKSSLVNALFGELRAATDVVPTTAQITPYILSRPELGGTVIVLDMGGYADSTVAEDRIAEALAEVQRSDVVLLVTSATNAARAADRQLLRLFDAHFAAHPDLRPPVVIGVLSHIDLLRPVREWNPPYNVATPDAAKAHTIRAAMNAVATDLDFAPELIVPVCLLPERVYNVDEALTPFLVDVLPDAKRTLLLRSLKTLRQQEQWQLLGRQARTTGRFLWQLGGQVLKKSVEKVLTEGKL